MEQRLDFVREYESGLFTMIELAAQYGIAPKTGYKWLERFAAEGPLGLSDRSRRPHQSPHATDAALVDAIVALRRRYPRWGPKKLRRVLVRREPARAWPARSTVADLLKARGLVAPRRAARVRRPPGPAPLAPITRINETWTTDFKGEFRTGDGVYCYPLTLRDGFSRFVLACDALAGRTHEATQRRFERAFAEFGLPDRIRSDNGGPFASPGLGGLSRLSVWWMRLGILPERIAPGHPEQNGSHEQFHAVLKADTARPPARDRAAQQRRFTRFRHVYNVERPHEALADDPPATHYRPSSRPLPRRLPPLVYPAHWEIRRVWGNGCVSFVNDTVFLASALGGQDVAFEEIDDGIWTLHFSTVALARYDERTRILRPLPIAVNGGRSAGYAGSAPDLQNENGNE
jgi:transposase InsO family protein